MKRIATLLLAFVPLFAQPATPIAETTLANGLKILVLEKHTTPVVAVQVWYRVGSHNEPAGVKGIAHFTEHMMFRGSAHYARLEHTHLIDDQGGDCNGFTDDDYTAYVERLPAHEMELALKLEADRMTSLLLDSSDLATEANVVREEYRMGENDPMGEVYQKALKLLYGNHPYAFGPIGLMTDLESLNVAKTRTFFEAHYAPNNAVLIVTGDVRAESVFAEANRWFDPIPARAIAPEPNLLVPPQTAQRRFSEKVTLPVPFTAISFWLPPARSRDIIPLQVLNSILSGGESSRLQKALVRDRELAVAALSFPLVRQGTGLFAFGAVYLPNISSRKIEDALWTEINRLKTEPVSDDELAKARKQLLAGKVFARYSASSLALSLGYAELAQGDYRMYQREVEEYGKVTKDDVQRVAREYLTPENSTVLTFQPKQSNPLIWLAGVVRSIFG